MTSVLESIKSQLLAGELEIIELKDHQDQRSAFIPVFTTCRVYSLSQKGTIIGYYKEEKYGRYGGAVMGFLTYELATMLGISKRLVPCIKIEPFSIEGTHYQGGSVQPAQVGISLKDYLEYPEKRKAMIKKDEYIDALIDSIVLGLFDAHSNNVLVDSRGGIHFFDLTRSFPHSNAFLDRGGYHSYPYLCDLLLMAEASSILTLKRKKELVDRLKKVRDKLPAIKGFLLSETFKNHSKDLPQNWFFPKKVFQALQERIERLIQGCEDHKLNQLRDAVFLSFPYYKFICLLNYSMLLDWRAHAKNQHLLNRCLRDIELPLFYEILNCPIEGMIDECVKLGLDPYAIKEYAENESLVQAMSAIVHEVQNKLVHTETPIEERYLIQRSDQLKSKLNHWSEIDFKDWGENYPDEDFFNS